MKQTSKLKPTRWIQANLIGIIVVTIFFTIFALIRSISAEETADIISGIIYIAITIFLIFLWFKAHQTHVFPLILMILLLAVHFFTGLRVIIIIANVILLAIFIYMIFLFLKHTYMFRRVLELAAVSVRGAQNGFTTRPLYSGKAEYSKGEIIGFAKFLEENVIAIPFQDTNGIILSFPEDWLGRKHDIHGSYLDDTHITFDNEGNVSAVISKRDYSKYKDELTFDRLCESFGRLFIEFLELYKKGDGEKILDRIKTRN
jgi:hypothetical protein